MRMNANLKILLLAVWLLLAQPVAWAQPQTQREETGEGFLVTEGFEEVNQWLTELVEMEKTAGISALVLRNGVPVLWVAHGVQELGEDTPLGIDSIFRIYSMTKAIASVAAMQLVEEGKMSLDDPIANYLPEWEKVRVLVSGSDSNKRKIKTESPFDPILVRHLLRHTSGLPYAEWTPGPLKDLFAKELKRGQVRNLKDLSQRLAKLPLAHHPGASWTYGRSTDVLGRLIEVVAKKPFEKVLEDRIFDPLEMDDTAFHVPASKWSRLVAVHSTRPDGRVGPKLPGYETVYKKTPRAPSGGGGLVSTLKDYGRFLQMLLQQGEWEGVQIIKPETLAGMIDPEPSLALPNPFWARFGLGFELNGFNRKTGLPDTYGWSGMARTFYRVFPGHDTAAIVFTQAVPFSPEPGESFFHQVGEALESLVDED